MRLVSFFGAFVFITVAVLLLATPIWLFRGSIWDIDPAIMIVAQGLRLMGAAITIAMLALLRKRGLICVGVGYCAALALYVHLFAGADPGDLETALSFLAISGGMASPMVLGVWMCLTYTFADSPRANQQPA